MEQTNYAIQTDNLSYAYPGSNSDVIQNLNFHVETGSIFGFLGPSGAGKSTTQSILTRQIQAGFRGQVSILGKPLVEWGRDIYNKIGVSFELPNHYLKLTAKENLDLFASLYEKPAHSAEELLKMLGLQDARDQRVGDFSKGMKMRLNFARSLLHDPDLLFLDEPTSGLDPGNARNIKDIILDLKSRGKTIFITTHNMNDADELCDRVAFLVDGEIKLIDSPQELKLAHGKKRVRVEYLNSGKPHTQYFELVGLGTNRKFYSLLKENEIRTIHTEEAGLVDIFIQTTGRTLS